MGFQVQVSGFKAAHGDVAVMRLVGNDVVRGPAFNIFRLIRGREARRHGLNEGFKRRAVSVLRSITRSQLAFDLSAVSANRAYWHESQPEQTNPLGEIVTIRETAWQYLISQARHPWTLCLARRQPGEPFSKSLMGPHRVLRGRR